MFTGKNKEDFERWLLDNQPTIEYVINEDGETDVYKIDVKKFYEHPFSMQQGVYLEYLRSINIALVVFPTTTHYRMYVKEFNGKMLVNEVEDVPNSTRKIIKYYDTYDEALTEAFKKTDELINNK